MTRPGRLRFRSIVGLAAALAATALVAAGPTAASAAPSDDQAVAYAALGDSYAAGQATDCSHPSTSYPKVLDRLRSVRLVQDLACAGATTASVLTTQVPVLRHDVRLVTITVGANDLDVAGLAAVCGADPASVGCGTAIALRQQQLPTLYAQLRATITAVAATSPDARIVVTGYPSLAASGPIAVATQALDDTIRSAAVAARSAGYHVVYVGPRFTGHTLDSAAPWFYPTGPDAFHPTPAGEFAYARAVAKALHLGLHV